jgi:hypothetical protein
MAKKKESDDGDIQEKQEPEKPKKKSTGLSLPMIIGIVFGVVLVQVILIIVIFKFVIAPAPQTVAETEDSHKTEQVDKHKTSDEDEDYLSEEDKKKLINYEITNIAATPKGMDRSVFIDINFTCLPKEEELVKELSKEFDKTMVGKSLIADMKYKINEKFSGYTKEELDNISRDTISARLMADLKPIFLKEGVSLKKILVKWTFY